MALDLLLSRDANVAAASTVYPTGPLNYQDPVGSYVTYIDIHGRIGIDETYAAVCTVAGPVVGTCQVILQSDDNTGFASPTDQYTWATAITTTNGRNANGTGPHLLGYVTGPMERYLRFKLIAAAAIGNITCALTRDWPSYDRR